MTEFCFSALLQSLLEIQEKDVLLVDCKRDIFKENTIYSRISKLSFEESLRDYISLFRSI